MKTTRMTGWIVPLLAAALVGCTANETRTGEGGTMVSGSGGAAGSQGESARLVRCQRPIGTAALLEPESASYAQYGLKSPVPLIKLMMAQSGCFKVVARGASSSALQRERAMAAGGDMQKGSNMGGGQMVAADYIIQPEILYQDANAGGGDAIFGLQGTPPLGDQIIVPAKEDGLQDGAFRIETGKEHVPRTRQGLASRPRQIGRLCRAGHIDVPVRRHGDGLDRDVALRPGEEALPIDLERRHGLGAPDEGAQAEQAMQEAGTGHGSP